MLSFTSRKPLTADEPFQENCYLFITTGTFQKMPFIRGDERKQLLIESLDFNCFKWDWRILAYAVLDNHYHLVVQTPTKNRFRIAHIIQSAHSFSAYHWRRDDPSIRSRIWWNFWESPLADQAMLISHINYLHDNPRFHGYTDQPETYAFSSYRSYLENSEPTIRLWEQQFPPQAIEVLDTFDDGQ